jgi:hypothetical protein
MAVTRDAIPAPPTAPLRAAGFNVTTQRGPRAIRSCYVKGFVLCSPNTSFDSAGREILPFVEYRFGRARGPWHRVRTEMCPSIVDSSVRRPIQRRRIPRSLAR